MQTSQANQWKAVMQDESGQDLIEYALVAALIGIVAIASIKGLSTTIANEFVAIGSKLTSAL